MTDEMTTMNNQELLLRKWAIEESSNVIQLLNHNRSPVAALYLNKLNLDKIVILESDCNLISERYYVYMDAIAILFTYMRKLNKEETL
jgi:hypothetical protein